MTKHLLTRTHTRPAPETTLTGPISFIHGRVHEICGPSRRSLAILLAARQTGPILWIRPSWARTLVNAQGMATALNPARMVFADAPSTEDIQWCAEEALRSGAAPTVIIETTAPPGLTPIRRLHLAAQAANTPCLSLLLTPEGGGAQGVETRWHIAPAHRPGLRNWALTRLRARMAPPASWALQDKAGTLSAA